MREVGFVAILALGTLALLGLVVIELHSDPPLFDHDAAEAQRIKATFGCELGRELGPDEAQRLFEDTWAGPLPVSPREHERPPGWLDRTPVQAELEDDPACTDPCEARHCAAHNARGSTAQRGWNVPTAAIPVRPRILEEVSA